MSSQDEAGVAQRGEWIVERKDTSFGEVIKHGLDASRVMLMGLPRLHGWRAISPICLPHQTYSKKVNEWLAENSGAREVAVLDPDSGEWKTVWEGA